MPRVSESPRNKKAHPLLVLLAPLFTKCVLKPTVLETIPL